MGKERKERGKKRRPWSHRKKRRVTRVDESILAVVPIAKTHPDDFILGTYDHGRCISCYELVVESKNATQRQRDEKLIACPHPWYTDDPSCRLHKFLGGILTCGKCFEFLEPGPWWDVRSADRACLLCGAQGRPSPHFRPPLVLLSLSVHLPLSLVAVSCLLLVYVSCGQGVLRTLRCRMISNWTFATARMRSRF